MVSGHQWLQPVAPNVTCLTRVYLHIFSSRKFASREGRSMVTGKWWKFSPVIILPACTTATAHTFAFEFGLVVDLMAIFTNRQAEVSTGGKTCETTVYKVWKYVAWSTHAVKSWLYVEHPVDWMLFTWHFFNHHLDTENDCQPLPCGGWENHNRKPIYSACQYTALFCITNRHVLKVYTS